MTKNEAACWLWEYTNWTSVRDDLIRMAHEAGMTKMEIHKITGIARTTIDRILVK